MPLDVRLRQRATVWARQITTTAHSNLGNKKKLITVQSRVEENGGKIGIISTAYPTAVSKYGDVKNVARAYEYGSGIHSTGRYGSKSEYIIKPRRRKVLAFFWDKVDENTPRGPKFRGISPETGRALFRYVEHPGVAAVNSGRGYLRPAIASVRKQMRQEIPKEIRQEVIGSFRKAFSKGLK